MSNDIEGKCASCHAGGGDSTIPLLQYRAYTYFLARELLSEHIPRITPLAKVQKLCKYSYAKSAETGNAPLLES